MKRKTGVKSSAAHPANKDGNVSGKSAKLLSVCVDYGYPNKESRTVYPVKFSNSLQ